MPPKLRAAGYVRVSVDHEDSSSIPQQIEAILGKCQREGWTIDPKVDIYEDRGRSGSKKEVIRPAFENLMKNATKYDRIVVFRFDRLSRRLSELSSTLETLHEQRVAVISVNEGFGTDTDHGRTVANIMGSLAAGEAEAIKQRTKNTQAGMFAAGKWKGGARPFGWEQSPMAGGGVRLVLKEDEAEILRKAVKLIVGGSTIGATARALNAAGDRTYKGTPFSPQMISHCLRSQIVVGRHVVNGKLSYGKDGKPITPHEPLLTMEEWDALQAALARLRVVRPKKGGALLSGVAHCGLCGGKLAGSSTETNLRANYRCRNKYVLLNGKCQAGVSIRALPIDELISLTILNVLKKKSNIQVAGKRMKQSHKEALRLRRKLEAEFEDNRRIHQSVRNQFLSGKYNYPDGDADYEVDFARATENLRKASAAIAEIEEVEDEPADLIPWTNSTIVEKKWETATNEERNKVIRALIEKVVVKPWSPSWGKRGLDPSRVEIVWRTGT
jgi:site-specific DNA recombinase